MISATVVVSFEDERSRRKSYSIKDKREFIQANDALVSTGASRRDACSRVGLPHMYYACFEKRLKRLMLW